MSGFIGQTNANFSRGVVPTYSPTAASESFGCSTALPLVGITDLYYYSHSNEMTSHLTVISISLVKNDIEYFFIVSFHNLCISHEKFKSFPHFQNWLLLFINRVLHRFSVQVH